MTSSMRKVQAKYCGIQEKGDIEFSSRNKKDIIKRVIIPIALKNGNLEFSMFEMKVKRNDKGKLSYCEQ